MADDDLACALPPALHESIARELHAALRAGRTIAPLVDRYPSMTIDDAYRVSLLMAERRLAEGERMIGKKIGVTSRVVQEMLNVDQPDFGFLTNAMQVRDGATIDLEGRFIQPRIEGEIAFLLRDTLRGPGVSAAAVLEATESIHPCFEVVDSRIEDWRISIVDTVADNASCGAFVKGETSVGPSAVDLDELTLQVSCNGQLISTGRGDAVIGGPAGAVAWLANTLARYGVALEAGDIVLSGSCVPLHPVTAGDSFELTMAGVGGCSVAFRAGDGAST